MKHTLSLASLVAAFACLPAHAQKLDLGDGTSAVITTKAWEALGAKNYEQAIAYAKTCVTRYETQAVEMQKELKAPVPPDDREAVSKKWALNDVGTCLFIMGQALEKQDKGTEALAAYKQLIEKVSFAQCWDPKGWFWKPADAAKMRIKALEFDTQK